MFHFLCDAAAAVWLLFPPVRHLIVIDFFEAFSGLLSAPTESILCSALRAIFRFFPVFVLLRRTQRGEEGCKREVQATNNGNKLNKLAKNHFLKVFCPRETRDNRLLLSYFFPSSFELRSACNQISTIQFHKLIFASRKEGQKMFSAEKPQKPRDARERRETSQKEKLFNLISPSERLFSSKANDIVAEQNDDWWLRRRDRNQPRARERENGIRENILPIHYWKEILIFLCCSSRSMSAEKRHISGR